MLVIQNRKIKKGIEIPEIEITLSNENKTITVSAIDTEKYADFLALNPNLVYATAEDGLINVAYLGIELIENSANVILYTCIALQFVEV